MRKFMMNVLREALGPGLGLAILIGGLAAVLSGAATRGMASEVSVTTLAGETHVGELSKVRSESLTLESTRGEVTLPREEVAAIEHARDPNFFPPISEAKLQVQLTDGSRVRAITLARNASAVTLETMELGRLELPKTSLAHVLMSSSSTPELMERWNELCQQANDGDLLVVRKGDRLDFLTGAVGNIDEKGVDFLVGERSAKVPFEKLFGIVLKQRETANPRSGFIVDLIDDQTLKAGAIDYAEGKYRLQISSTSRAELDARYVKRIDLTSGKLRYLSDLKPARVNVEPTFQKPMQPGIDLNTYGKPLTVGNKVYRKGLCLDSRTEITYRLAGEYKSFQCQAGMDQSINPHTGNVALTIRGDGKVLYQRNFSTSQAKAQFVTPEPIQIDLTGVNEFTILVDYGEIALGIGDNLTLGDARLIR